MAAGMIAETLTAKGHTLTIKEALEVTNDDIKAAGVVILGSCTWDYNDMEGQPHEHMVEFLKNQTDISAWKDKKLAIFGLGDSSYTFFCGSVTYMETFAKRNNLTLAVSSLKIDGFFYKQQENTENLQKWATELASKLT